MRSPVSPAARGGGALFRFARLENDLKTERADRQALLDRVQAQEAKRFDLLHEWRAKAMMDSYAALCNLEDAHEDFSKSFGGFEGGPTPLNYWEKLAKAGSAFRDTFWSRRILFDVTLANDLTQLNRAYVEISNRYLVLYNTERVALRGNEDNEAKRRRIEYDVLSEILRSERYHKVVSAISDIQREIELRFRSLFGVT